MFSVWNNSLRKNGIRIQEWNVWSRQNKQTTTSTIHTVAIIPTQWPKHNGVIYSTHCHFYVPFPRPFLLFPLCFLYPTTGALQCGSQWRRCRHHTTRRHASHHTHLPRMLGMPSCLHWHIRTEETPPDEKICSENSQDGELENAIVITGDVYYNRPTGLWRIVDKCSYTDTAYVTYRHPDGNAEDGSPRFVQKKIRTYHPYHREHVPILVLKDLPLSGQPKPDVERDIASFQRWVLLVLL